MNRIKTKKLCTWRLACELKANRRDSHCPLPARAQVLPVKPYPQLRWRLGRDVLMSRGSDRCAEIRILYF